MLMTLVIALALLLALLLYASTRPDTFRVERSVLIHAAPEKIHALIDDLHGFNQWNPWARKDPAIKGTYAGPASGKGAAYAWESVRVGTGRMEIIDSAAPVLVTLKLDFLKPFEGHNTAEFRLLPDGDATRVTWSMYGPANFISKLMQIFFSMDAMIGKDFDAGLGNLKALAEAQ